jgi:DNA excision repair protein ERCC-2
MEFDVDARTASLSVGEFSGFAIAPRESGEGVSGAWRAQLGTEWHGRLRQQVASERTDAQFEVAIEGRIAHRGWVLHLTGRIDQFVPGESPAEAGLLREIKTVTRELPTTEEELRAAYPGYFVQIASYAALRRLGSERESLLRAELQFIEAGSGLSQVVALTPADDALFRSQLDCVTEFLEARRAARDRLRRLAFRHAFEQPRAGQETTVSDLAAAIGSHPGPILFEAPTGFGKTGVALEAALQHLHRGTFERVIYLTGKATGQLQVVSTLSAMVAASDVRQSHVLRDNAPGTGADAEASSVTTWLVRNKGEHCVNQVFECVREQCRFLDGAAARWKQSGLARFWLTDKESNDIESLRRAGRAATICPYEITRAALAFKDVWVGDYNYVFAPSASGLFRDQPGFRPEHTLLVIDEAHNLPSRAADSLSHRFDSLAAEGVSSELRRLRVHNRLLSAWESWARFLASLRSSESLPLEVEEDARHLVGEIGSVAAEVPVANADLAPGVGETLWALAAAAEQLRSIDVRRHWWSPAAGQLEITCLDAAAHIGTTLSDFAQVVFLSATFGPPDVFSSACGLDEEAAAADPAAATPPGRLGSLNRKETKQLYAHLTSGAELLRVEEQKAGSAPLTVRAATPWRDGAYDVACDVRADTRFQHRSRYFDLTAETLSTVRGAARGAIAAFFSSYAYSDAIREELQAAHSELRISMQPRRSDLASKTEWVESALADSDILILVLGSSFAEGIDLLGGRISHAVVVGPALPEVNAIQKARLADLQAAGLTREEAFRRVYQIPGMTKVNQALGRLVRASGQRAKVLLHCQRFVEPGYASLLAPEYRGGTLIADDAALERWLNQPVPT